MSTRKAIIATTLAAALLATVPFVNAAPRGHRGPGGPGGPGIFGRHMQEELELSDAQTDQLRGIFAELHSQNAAYRGQLQGGFHEVTKTLIENPNNLAAAQAMLDQQTSAQRAMKANRLAAMARALNVLTPAQRTELAQLIEERAERRKGRGRRGSTR